MQITVLDYLDRTASMFPDKTAFKDQKESVTFGELRDKGRAIASALLPLAGSMTGHRVAIAVDRTVRPIIAFMGALYSGGCYVPIDVHMPADRMKMILDTAQPVAIIDGTCSRFRLPEEIYQQYSVLQYEELCHTPCNEQALAGMRRNMADTDPIYILFTSGSTGVPKGVCVSHRAVIDFTDWLAQSVNITSDDVLGNQAPFYFDVAGKDIYLALKCGVTVNILTPSMFSFTGTLMKKLNAEKITVVFWAAAAVRMVASSGILKKNPPQYLRCVGFGGEVLPVRWLNEWRQVLPDAIFMNMYGPTETTIDCTYYIVDREYTDEEELPIGIACENMQAFLVDEEGRLVTEPNKQGELCIKGTGLALGYFNAPEKTAENFRQNPLHNFYPDTVYFTGDLCQYKEDGMIYFIARKDNQIKHQGYRIELGEIETAVNGVEGVEVAVCLFDKENDVIICVYQGSTEQEAMPEIMLDRLPKYMMPGNFVRMDKLPLNANGKVDRVLLKNELINQN